MELRKIVPILAVMAMICIFFSMQSVSAAHQTEVKAYQYDPNDPPGDELGTDLFIKKGDALDIGATLHVDGGGPQWFRFIHMYIYNSKGNQIVNEDRSAGFGVARFWINSKKWEPGNYRICLIYWGNKDDDYPRADKEILLHIV